MTGFQRGCLHRMKYWRCLRWRCWDKWRVLLTASVIVLDCLVLIIVLPILIWQLNENHTQAHVQLWFIAGLFMLLTIPIFLFGIMQHLTHYSRPNLQRHLIRILWIVPIYSIDSFIALRHPSAAIYVDTMRECYEAYVIYNFVRYLINYLEAEYDLAEEFRKMDPLRCPLPFCCLPPTKLTLSFIRRCKFGVLQYAVLRILVTVVAFITELTGNYKEGKFVADGAWLYLTIINTLSQGVALHTLVYIYKATSELLKPIKPVWKFLSIKAIIFFSFWQAVALAILDHSGVFKDNPDVWKNYGIENVATGLQDFIICIEMFLAVIAHYFVFSHKPYTQGRAKVPCLESFLRMIDVRDVGEDVKEQAIHFQNKAKDAAITAKNVAVKVLKTPGNTDQLKKAEELELLPLLRDNQGTYDSKDDLSPRALQFRGSALYVGGFGDHEILNRHTHQNSAHSSSSNSTGGNASDKDSDDITTTTQL